MRATAKIGAVVAAGALAVAVPAAAHPAHPSHSSGTDPGKSHKCATHEVAYVAHGTVGTWTPPPTGNGPYSGTLTVNVTKANHHAPKGPQTYMNIVNAKVRFDQGTTPATSSGDPVTLIGKIAVAPAANKGCTTPTGTSAGTITVKKIDVHALKPTK
jgi:hypothetical protein